MIPVVRDLTQTLVRNSGLNSPGPEVFMGVLMAAYSGAQMLSAPFWGIVSDRYGRKPVFLISILGNIASYAVWILSNTYWLFLAGRVLSGITGGNIAIAQSIIADHTTAEERPRAMGLLGACIGMGFVLGPFLGAVLVSIDPWHGDFLIKINPFYTIGVAGLLLSLLALLMIIFSQIDSSDASAHSEHAMPWQIFRGRGSPAYLVQLFSQISFVTFEVLLAWILQRQYGFGLKETYYFFGAQGVLMALVQGGVYRRLEKRRLPQTWVRWSLILSMACMALLPWVGFIDAGIKLLFLVLLLFALTFASGFGQPSLQAYASIHAPRNQQGRTMGSMQGLAALARFITPVMATGLYTWWLPLPFALAALLCLTAWWFFRKTDNT